MNVRVLFVDDESRILQGMRRMLFAQGLEWDCAFATRGDEALEILGNARFDAVVTDMCMAPMDGIELLRQVCERWPSMLRIALSGHTNAAAAIRALQLAHQFLSKPCDARVLIETILGGLAAQSLLADPAIRTAVGRLSAFPAAPRTHAEITAALAEPECDARRIADLLARDPGLTANVLHLANSAFFPSSRPAADLGAAVARVGLANVGDLVLATEVFDTAIHGPIAERLREQGLRASRIAARIGAGCRDAATAATAALLADIGWLLPEIAGIEVAETLSEHAHAEVGAYLLGLWGLPAAIVEAVAHHHAPTRIESRDVGVHGIVHIAVALACGEEPDPDFIASHRLEGRLAEWKALLDPAAPNHVA